MKGGWFIGNFSPSVLQTNQFEVCYNTHKKGEKWDVHYHKIATEINYLVRGKMLIQGVVLEAGDIFTISPMEVANPEFIEDCELVIVKIPSAKNDKFIINKYTEMQTNYYEQQASLWTVENRDPVVGSFDAHNDHQDYELLFKDLNVGNMIALDFGCGPGRNLVKYQHRFKRLDGVDLSAKNLENAKMWCNINHITQYKLYQCNGVDLSNISNEEYDFIMSTITLQHICVHEIRYGYFKEFFRVLRPGGWIGMQMGAGTNNTAVDYFVNHYDAISTNSAWDTRVDNVDFLRKDIESIGFTNFRYELRGPGPGDYYHQFWIYFQAHKESND